MPKYLLTAIVTMLFLPGCSVVGVATGAGATLGLSAAQEGGLSRAASDARIQAEINNAWFNYNVDVFTKLDITVNQGRVLVTGVVQDPQHRVEAIRLIWQVKGVKQVINEVQVAESGGISGFLKDSWILTSLRSHITLDKEIQSLNYNIDAVAGTVYLLGVAQDQEELNRVIEAARTTSGVRQVVSYVKIAGPQPQVEPFERTYQDFSDTPQTPYQQPATTQIQAETDEFAPVEFRDGDVLWDGSAPAPATDAPQSLTGIEAEPLE